MAGSRERAVEDLAQLVNAVDQLQAGLRAAKSSYRRALRALQLGDTVQVALEAGASAETRERITAVLEEFERVRLTSRLSLVAAGAEEGMSINAMSRTWGISRQLASRYLHRVRGDE